MRRTISFRYIMPFVGCVLLCVMTLAMSSRAYADRIYTIGETQITSHPALDADQRGFEAGLADTGFQVGQNLIILRQDARGSFQRAYDIAREFVDTKVDLIHTISTPSTIAALQAGSRIPIVFSSVMDPVASGIVNTPARFRSSSDTRVTGVSDLWPASFQMQLYQRMYPEAKEWGVLYNPAEPNSVAYVRILREVTEQLGLTLVEVTVDRASDVPKAIDAFLGKVRAILVPGDNTVTENLSALIAFGEQHKIPVFAGDLDSVRAGAAAAYGMDYFLVGYVAGRKAGLILKGIDPADIPWGPVAQFSLVVNMPAARRQGLNISPAFLEIADKVIE